MVRGVERRHNDDVWPPIPTTTVPYATTRTIRRHMHRARWFASSRRGHCTARPRQCPSKSAHRRCPTASPDKCRRLCQSCMSCPSSTGWRHRSGTLACTYTHAVIFPGILRALLIRPNDEEKQAHMHTQYGLLAVLHTRAGMLSFTLTHPAPQYPNGHGTSHAAPEYPTPHTQRPVIGSR